MFNDIKQKLIKTKKNNQNIKFGFLNKNNNNSLYINFSSWVKMNGKLGEYDYLKEFNIINKNIKILLYKNLNTNFFDNRNFIIDLDIRQNGLKPKMKSFFVCEITLFKNKGFFEPDEDLKKSIEEIINIIISKELKDSKIFSYYLKK